MRDHRRRIHRRPRQRHDHRPDLLAHHIEETVITDGAWPGIARRIRDEGYGATPVFLAPPALARLNGAIDALTAEGWPATFAWVFDEFWSAARTTAVRGLLAAALGPGVRQVPHVWVHIVPAVSGARGWGPHKDGGLARGSRAHLSVWIALSDATVDNGCIYVLPRSAASAALVDQDWSHGVLPIAETIRLVSGVRALPAEAGLALAWDFDLLHWSGVRTGGGPARRSLSLEFIGADVEPAADEHPLIGGGPDDPLPAFAERLACIASGILHRQARSGHQPLPRAGGAAAYSVCLSLCSSTCSGLNRSICR